MWLVCKINKKINNNSNIIINDNKDCTQLEMQKQGHQGLKISQVYKTCERSAKNIFFSFVTNKKQGERIYNILGLGDSGLQFL